MRYPSVDILRTVAIVVMVLVHFPENLSNYTPPFTGLGAPLFTFLSGVSYQLWVNGQESRGVDNDSISKISIRRGLFVIGVGFAFNILVWLPEDVFIWDVLTFIGTAILILNLLRRQPSAILITIAIAAIAISPAMRASAEYDAYWVNGYFEGDPTLSDLIIGFLAAGYFPLFPWISYSLIGFVTASLMFPQDRDAEPSVRPFVAFGAGMICLAIVARLLRGIASDVILTHVLTGWRMFPPSVEYLCATIGMAILLLGLLHQYVDRNDRVSTDSRAFLLAKTFSRYAFTIYVLHHIVHLYPLWIYGYAKGNETTAFWQKAMPVTLSIPLAVLFLACCYAILSRLNPNRRYGIEGWMRWLCD